MAQMAYPNPSENIKKSLKYIISAVVGVFALIILINILSFFTIIEPGERGILVQFGSIKDIYQPGLHFQIPLINSVIKLDVRTQKKETEVNAASANLQSIHTIVALTYHIDPGKVDSLYRQIGTEYEDRIISPAIQESVKAATAQFTAEELITKRPLVKEEIKGKLSERLEKSFIVVDDFSIVDFNFSEDFNKAIEEKQTAIQEASKAENDLKRIQIEAQQKIETAKADAESIRIQGEALKENNNLIQLKMVEKWNGILPTYLLGNGVPFLNIPGISTK